MLRIVISTLFSTVFIFTAKPATGLEDQDGPRLLEKQAAPVPFTKDAKDYIRVDVDMTLVPVTVTDQFGRNVSGLGRQNFEVYDEAEQRPIVAFSREDAPVSVGIVFDCSRSMRDKFQTSRAAASQLFEQLDPDQDEAFLVTVSDRAVLRHDFTSNFGDIGDALTFVRPDGTTSLLDGVYFALSHMKKAHNPRKAVVIVSDGGDNNSRYNLKELLRKAQESNVLIYTIGIFHDPQSPEEVEGPELLSTLSQKTGGREFTVDPDSVAAAMSTIGQTLHNQYLLGYYPPQSALSGKYRKIKVKLRVPAGLPRLQIYARAGYYVP
jgi:Ca-activated chloride channel homolog